MAKIIDENSKRRTIRLSTDDIINVVREFQNLTYGKKTYNDQRLALDATSLFVPEDLF